jgi:Phytanoyl-CoA dioxygenase (PhyH)
MLADLLPALERDGFATVPRVFTAAEAGTIAAELSDAVRSDDQKPSMRSASGKVVAARNVLKHYPQAATVWRRPALVELLRAVLGPDFGLVRVLFFDKPPDRTWALAWHKDLTIAVGDNRLPSEQFRKPTLKAGVPHVEAPVDLLQQMLTLRIHLDDVTEENGPLQVMPGSHRSGKELDASTSESQAILAQAGDVLAMRPLISHSSGSSAAATRRHRRVLHLEFAGQEELPDGFAWHEFLR